MMIIDENKLVVVIDENNQNKRLDVALANLTLHSRAMIQKIFKQGKIKLNNEPILKLNQKTQLGEIYTLEKLEISYAHITPDNGALEIIFEDENLMVINKEANLVVHPGAGNPDGTLMNRLVSYCELSDLNGNERLGIVHRLDKGVSGCMIIAKTNQAHENLAKQFFNREIQKEYIAICYGKITSSSGILEDKIERNSKNRKKMAITATGKDSVMGYKVEQIKYLDEKNGFLSVVRCFPKTGRMHQIRLQFASRKFPIVGDSLYHTRQNEELVAKLGPRIALHAYGISFKHPVSGEMLRFVAPEPKEFSLLLL